MQELCWNTHKYFILSTTSPIVDVNKDLDLALTILWMEANNSACPGAAIVKNFKGPFTI